MPSTVEVKPPQHDTRIKGPAGLKRRARCILIHTTQGNQREGPGDRHGVIDYIAGKSIAVPWVTDDDGITRMTPFGHLGDNHACGLDEEATGIEQVGMAQWGRKAWLGDHRETVRNTGKVVAYELAQMGLRVDEANLRKHVFGHAEDEKCDPSACSDHWDPGPGYPYDVMFADAIAYAAVVGWRVVATKGELRRVRRFRRLKFAKRWSQKVRRQGWRVVRGRPRLSGGEVEDARRAA